MKIGILTHYNVSSHGAVLQMYGLQQCLKEMGHEVAILTYTTNYDFIDEQSKKRFSKNLKNLPYYISSYVGEDGIGTLFYQVKKQKKLKEFRMQNFRFAPYTNSKDLDCVVVGSDEVFALENGLDFVMFGHGISAKKIVAYAPSMGQTDIDRIEKFGCREIIASGLNKFSAMSARDTGTKEAVEQITGRNVPLVCDPALLYPFRHPDKQKQKKKYIVVYSYQSNFKNKERIQYIKKFAKENQCELWSVGVYYKWCDKHINCDPLEMIDVFANAEYVITDTFHGTITSYIAHTPMAVFVRNNNNKKLDHLLELIGIANRKVTDPSCLYNVLKENVDFDVLDKNVAKLRENGAQFLTDALNG